MDNTQFAAFVPILISSHTLHTKCRTNTEPITEIHGGPDIFINKGSTINLTCVVKFAPEPPPAMVWSHNREVNIWYSDKNQILFVKYRHIILWTNIYTNWFCCLPIYASGLYIMLWGKIKYTNKSVWYLFNITYNRVFGLGSKGKYASYE